MKFRLLATAVLAAMAFWSNAQATTLSGTLSVDNEFDLWVGTDDSTNGTFVTSGNDWTMATSFSGLHLTPGVVNYIHVYGLNTGLVDMFIGKFTLSDTNFMFANGAQTLLTEHRAALEKLAQQLLKRETVDGSVVEQVLEDTSAVHEGISTK